MLLTSDFSNATFIFSELVTKMSKNPKETVTLPVDVKGIKCEAKVDKKAFEDDEWVELNLSHDDIYFQGISLPDWFKAVEAMQEIAKKDGITF